MMARISPAAVTYGRADGALREAASRVRDLVLDDWLRGCRRTGFPVDGDSPTPGSRTGT